jgi:hypothetical protein
VSSLKNKVNSVVPIFVMVQAVGTSNPGGDSNLREKLPVLWKIGRVFFNPKMNLMFLKNLTTVKQHCRNTIKIMVRSKFALLWANTYLCQIYCTYLHFLQNRNIGPWGEFIKTRVRTHWSQYLPMTILLYLPTFCTKS